jgi:hypothetical protein
MHTTAHTEHGTAPATSAPHASTPAPSRHDGYLGIHKALRLFMTDTLTRVGRTDPGDDAEVHSTLEQVRDLLGLCQLHVKDENDFLHPALERARAGSAARAQQEHVQHLEAIHDLGDLAGLIADTRDTARAAAPARLYRAMALFVAENLEHMHLEETEHNAVLWAHYSDAELLGIEHALVASIPPQAMVKALYWFMPALNAPERAAMLQGMQRGMPPEAFLGIVDIARRTLAGSDFAKLARALGLPPVPGLAAA